MPKSRNRYARAQARARYRKPRRRNGSTAWNLAIGAIVIVGVVLIVYTVKSKDALGSGLQLSDHWHAALGVNVCGQWEPDQNEFVTRPDNPSVHAGLHTHGDGLIHMEPQNSSEIGDRATLGLFADYGDWKLSKDAVQDWTRTEKKTGDKCSAGGVGKWQWSVNGKVRHGNPVAYKPNDGDVIVLAFIPQADDITKLGDPPSTANLPTAETQHAPAGTVPPASGATPGSTAPPPSP